MDRTDVLAVIDEVIEGMGGPTDLGLKEARAIVAELIAENYVFQQMLSSVTIYPTPHPCLRDCLYDWLREYGHVSIWNKAEAHND